MELTKENALLAIPLLQAVAEGKRVQRRARRAAGRKWEFVVVTNLDFAHYEYRIKPEPSRIRVVECSACDHQLGGHKRLRYSVSFPGEPMYTRSLKDIERSAAAEYTNFTESFFTEELQNEQE
jgi:hypothetical protein